MRFLRRISYTKYGEIYSKPRVQQFEKRHHPVLGTYISEFPIVENKPNLKDTYPNSSIDLSSNDLMTSLINNNNNNNPLLSNMNGHQFGLGEVVFVKRKNGKENNKSFMGVIIEFKSNGPSPFLRLRNVLMGVGTEMKIPLNSPLIEEIKILRKPENPIDAPNLLGLRDNNDELAKFINPALFNEKARILFMKQIEGGKKTKVDP